LKAHQTRLNSITARRRREAHLLGDSEQEEYFLSNSINESLSLDVSRDGLVSTCSSPRREAAMSGSRITFQRELPKPQVEPMPWVSSRASKSAIGIVPAV